MGEGGTSINHVTQFVLFVIFFGVIAAVPAAWFLLGRKTYGTGDYHQP